MREKEIKEEWGLCVRCFLESQERAKQKGIDDFDELRILEASFNRLFLSVEHLCNAIMLLEKGNYSKKHFGDIAKLKEFKEKYQIDLTELYQNTNTFRAYADYRKFQETKDRFTKAELNNQINKVKTAIEKFFGIIKRQIDVKEISEKLEGKEISSKNNKQQ